MAQVLTVQERDDIHAWWRAANYLSVGQIYLLDNPLLRRPLEASDVKPRLIGHWGTTPGLNFTYVHLNRLIRTHDVDMIYITGPGHGGPAMVANAWLEGTFSEIYSNVSRDEAGMQRLFKQFSFPGGVPSHVAPEVPGSIHEGGELGYALSHAWRGLRQPGPDRRGHRRRRRVRDRAAGRLLALQLVSRPHARRRGAADPAPERIQDRQLDRAGTDAPRPVARTAAGYGHEVLVVEGDDPEVMHELMASTLETAYVRIREIQRAAEPAANNSPATPRARHGR